ncbi:MAG: RING finger protein [Oscillospiraceae bacterium]
MADYIGVKCIVCENNFTEDDDIVVCPDCGTPYHRACYNEKGACINTELHESGKSFKIPEKELDEMQAEKTQCPRCGEINPPLTMFCEKCGLPLGVKQENPQQNPNVEEIQGEGQLPFQGLNINFSDPLCGFNPEEKFEDATIAELGAFIGTNTHYYLPFFKRMKETKRKLALNFSAMLAPTLYYSYRKMPMLAILSFLIKFVISLPSMILILSDSAFSTLPFAEIFANINVNSQSFLMVSAVANFLSYGVIFVTGLLSNWFYYRHTLRKIKEIKQVESTGIPEQLKAKGGVSIPMMVTFIALPFVVAFVISFIAVL